LYVQVSILL